MITDKNVLADVLEKIASNLRNDKYWGDGIQYQNRITGKWFDEVRKSYLELYLDNYRLKSESEEAFK